VEGDLVEVDLAGRRLQRVSRAHDRIRFDVLPEIALLMGEVPCVPYATTGTPALGNAVEPFLGRRPLLSEG
jgi:hypothetical protein